MGRPTNAELEGRHASTTEHFDAAHINSIAYCRNPIFPKLSGSGNRVLCESRAQTGLSSLLNAVYVEPPYDWQLEEPITTGICKDTGCIWNANRHRSNRGYPHILLTLKRYCIRPNPSVE